MSPRTTTGKGGEMSVQQKRGHKGWAYINQEWIPGWRKNGCGIACTVMVLRRSFLKVFGKTENPFELCPSTDEIIEELTDENGLNGYIEGIGCKHAAIARLLTNWGIHSHTQEFTRKYQPEKEEESRRDGIREIEERVKNGGLVIVSIYRGFEQSSGSTHLVLVTGAIEEQGEKYFIIDDPDYTSGVPNMVVSHEKFNTAWRGYAIFAGTHSPNLSKTLLVSNKKV